MVSALMIIRVCGQKQPSGTKYNVCTRREVHLPLVPMVVPMNFQRRACAPVAGEGTTMPMPGPPPAGLSAPSALCKCCRGAWRAAPQDGEDGALSSLLPPPFCSPAMPRLPVSPSAFCPLSLSRSCTCEFTCDFWL